MKEIFAFLFRFARVRGSSTIHNDSLRANQGGERATPWRLFVG
jgi:hypothetical protein